MQDGASVTETGIGCNSHIDIIGNVCHCESILRSQDPAIILERQQMMTDMHHFALCTICVRGITQVR